jgi:hypothetical protein
MSRDEVSFLCPEVSTNHRREGRGGKERRVVEEGRDRYIYILRKKKERERERDLLFHAADDLRRFYTRIFKGHEFEYSCAKGEGGNLGARVFPGMIERRDSRPLASSRLCGTIDQRNDMPSVVENLLPAIAVTSTRGRKSKGMKQNDSTGRVEGLDGQQFDVLAVHYSCSGKDIDGCDTVQEHLAADNLSGTCAQLFRTDQRDLNVKKSEITKLEESILVSSPVTQTETRPDCGPL